MSILTGDGDTLVCHRQKKMGSNTLFKKKSHPASNLSRGSPSFAEEKPTILGGLNRLPISPSLYSRHRGEAKRRSTPWLTCIAFPSSRNIHSSHTHRLVSSIYLGLFKYS